MIGGCSSVSCPTLPIYSLILFFTTKIDEHPKKKSFNKKSNTSILIFINKITSYSSNKIIMKNLWCDTLKLFQQLESSPEGRGKNPICSRSHREMEDLNIKNYGKLT
jgi:hypothetical protein